MCAYIFLITGWHIVQWHILSKDCFHFISHLLFVFVAHRVHEGSTKHQTRTKQCEEHDTPPRYTRDFRGILFVNHAERFVRLVLIDMKKKKNSNIRKIVTRKERKIN